MSEKFIPQSRSTAMLLVLGLLTLFPPLATDMYLSAIGHVADTMQSTRSAAELSLSLFFLGLCLGQLILGPLIDSYGRKLPLMLGIVLFCVTTIALIVVENIWVFNTLRVFQAIGACSGMIVSRAIVNDLYEGADAAKIMTLLVMMLTIGPIISPTLGSFLLEAFGWRSIFVCMLSVGLLAFLLTWVILPETLAPADRVKAPFKTARVAAKQLLMKKDFILPTLIAGLIQGGMFSFITGSSRVFQDTFGLTPREYGLTFAAIAFALLVFGRINTWLLNKFDPRAILTKMLPVHLICVTVLTLSTLTDSLILLVIPLWFSLGLVGLLSANSMALSMAAARSSSGVGSALLGAIQFSIAFIISSEVAVVGSLSSLPMTLGFLIPSVIAFVILQFYIKTIKINAVENEIQC